MNKNTLYYNNGITGNDGDGVNIILNFRGENKYITTAMLI